MAIHKKTRTQNKADVFLTGAPDAGAVTGDTPYDKGIAKGNKRQISITISSELLRQTDVRAEAMGTGRSAFISMALYKTLNE